MGILVVDDSRAMRMIVQRELRKAGYENISEAENGAVALETVMAGGVDLVLCDWNMPDMNGLELLTALRERGNQVTFGFVTSESAGDVRMKAREAGAAFVVTKPFTSEILDREIMLALGEDVEVEGDGGERTLDTVLEGLLGRDVSVSPSKEPRRALPRGLAEYDMDGKPAYAMMEMSLAAGLACALARVPSGEAEQWAKSHAFSDMMEANFFEVANVLGAFASQSSQRCVLKSVAALGEGELPSELREAKYHTTVTVDIDGYPGGRLGFTAA